MFEIKVDPKHRMVAFTLTGLVTDEEASSFIAQLEAATLALQGEAIRLIADVRGLRPASPSVARRIREVQSFGLRHGVRKIAELVESDIVARQLNQLAHESGAERILRRFWDDDSARNWLSCDTD